MPAIKPQVCAEIEKAIETQQHLHLQYLNTSLVVIPQSIDGEFLTAFNTETERFRRFRLEFIHAALIVRPPQ